MRAHGWIRGSRRSLLPSCRGHRRRLLVPFLFTAAAVAALPGPVGAWQAHFAETPEFSGSETVTIDDEGNVIAGGLMDLHDQLGRGITVKLAPDGTLLWQRIDELGTTIYRVVVVPGGDVIVHETIDGADELDDGQPTVTRLLPGQWRLSGSVWRQRTAPVSPSTTRPTCVAFYGNDAARAPMAPPALSP